MKVLSNCQKLFRLLQLCKNNSTFSFECIEVPNILVQLMIIFIDFLTCVGIIVYGIFNAENSQLILSQCFVLIMIISIQPIYVSFILNNSHFKKAFTDLQTLVDESK